MQAGVSVQLYEESVTAAHLVSVCQGNEQRYEAVVHRDFSFDLESDCATEFSEIRPSASRSPTVMKAVRDGASALTLLDWHTITSIPPSELRRGGRPTRRRRPSPRGGERGEGREGICK